MSLLRRKPEESTAPTVDTTADDATKVGKGRPTPKRRTQSGPVSPAPRTRKEALAWQKEQRKKKTATAGQKRMTAQEYREAVKAGDPRVLPARDQGPLRTLARDYVDSHRMFSNYLLLLFPFMILGYAIPVVQYGVLACFLLIVVEWYFTARTIKRLALSRGIQFRDGTFSIAMYAGSRAYFPRSWRRPLPRVGLGDEI